MRLTADYLNGHFPLADWLEINYAPKGSTGFEATHKGSSKAFVFSVKKDSLNLDEAAEESLREYIMRCPYGKWLHNQLKGAKK